MALAFSGSGPTVQNAGFYQNKSAGSTPQGNALNQAQTPNWLTTLNNVQASTPLQSTTTSHPDGTSVTHKFQSLDPSQTTSGIGMSMAPTGNANTGGGSGGGTSATSSPATPQTGSNPGMITPTTNADGSFIASDGSFHAANSPEAQNNKTMGSNATPPPVQTPPPPITPFNQAVKDTQQAYTDAGNTNQIIKQAEMNAQHNPEFSLDTGIGRAGQIEQNYGLMGQNALTRAAGMATTAGLIKPTVGAYGQTQYSPSNAGNNNGQVQPNDPYYKVLQQAAQQAANGQYSAIPSEITSNPVLNAQLNDMAKAINPSYNPVVSSAQSGITTTQTGQNAQYQQAINQGDNLASQANDLIKTLGLNPDELNLGNGAIQKIALNTSDPNYKSLQNYLSSLSGVYQPVLGDSASGQSLLDSTAKGTSITTTLNNLKSAVQAKMAGTITPPTSGSSGGGSTFTGSAWN